MGSRDRVHELARILFETDAEQIRRAAEMANVDVYHDHILDGRGIPDPALIRQLAVNWARYNEQFVGTVDPCPICGGDNSHHTRARALLRRGLVDLF